MLILGIILIVLALGIVGATLLLVMFTATRAAIPSLLILSAFGLLFLLAGILVVHGQTSGSAATQLTANTIASAPAGGATQGQSQPTPTCVDHEVKPGETYTVPPGCNIKGDVELFVNGQFVQQKQGNDPKVGTIVSCPQGCTIRAPFGANVGPRTVPDLTAEMKSKGCIDGCTTVNVVTADGSQACQGKDCAPRSGVPTVSNCGGELKLGETRAIPAGCTIVGDVVVNGQLQKPVGRGSNTVGYVQQLAASTTVTAPFGAAVYDSTMPVQNLVQTTKSFGCDQPGGCSNGVYDWSGNRLDQQ